MSKNKIADCFKALGDDTRAKIFEILLEGKLTASDILNKFDISQPTLSYHLRQLVSCDLLNAEKKGTWIYYEINETVWRELIRFLQKNSENEEEVVADLENEEVKPKKKSKKKSKK